MVMFSPTEALRPNLHVEVASGDTLDVRKFQVTERVSDLFEVRLVALSPNPEIDFEAVLGREATFTLSRDRLLASAYRTWGGICHHIQQIESEEAGLSTYELVIVPKLWFLTQRRNHRMFQQLSDLDVVLQVLREWGIEPVQKVDAAAYKKRKYRVQYGESDYAFVCRLLEDAGITFYFDQQGEDTVLVLHDAPQDNPPREPAVRFVDKPMVDKDLEFVTEVRVGQRTRPGKYTIFDHDYRRPANYKLMGTHAEGEAFEQQMERFHYVPGAFLFRTDGREPTPSADDKGAARHDESEAKRIARIRLEAKRVEARKATFRTNLVELRPGTVMRVVDHPRRELSNRLLVVHSTYEGTSFGEWVHKLETRSAEIHYRPPLVTPKPKVSGVESATVVGPAGEEIHTDEFGRVRVHFHWDRESQMNQDSSCWIHVSQSWGGAGYGGVQLPRIGQEVIVDFLGGDPDRPIIVGRVFTNLQKVPYPLPANKTQSGLRSASSPATGGYNELMFEDAAGRELMRLQAERDFTGLVKHDMRFNIQNDRTHNVGNNDTESVVGEQSVKVAKKRTVRVKLDQQHQVGENILTQAVNGTATHMSNKALTLFSPEKIVLSTAPNSFILITPGKITIEAPLVHINPGDTSVPNPPQPDAIGDATTITGYIGAP
ncbi:type VI secretion system Vgr family protein [Polyangium jinanense]|uniref:Type VI secretion system tip protein VgrG n=1 Tax=Polyangium jinanense TaxID=2829994 RepID=A0A9X3XDV2_9BACT|nr:type VI secretion system tip protein TssI/VgrG [Polyangium jinanense]MDC3956781.1 type VI secretion system tip protein VgrG [Polyangium jinanense]MDC3987223.1 type VI secretion system tip protein VgrG [Polyangium jinanense]